MGQEIVFYKDWWKSSFVWLGVIETLIGGLELLANYLEKGDFTPTALVLLIAGIFTVARRVWGTPTRLR